jgi:hypothetical protein
MSNAEGVKVQTVDKSIEETEGILCGTIGLKSFWKQYRLGA